MALPLAFPLEGCATLAGVGYSATSAVALLPATLNTSVAGMPSSPQKFGPSNPDGANCSLSASAFGDSGFVGASAALWVGPRSQLSAAVQRGERAFGLPSPTLGGKWAKESDEVKRGYFLIDIPPEKFNETVAYAARAGFPDTQIATHSFGVREKGEVEVRAARTREAERRRRRRRVE